MTHRAMILTNRLRSAESNLAAFERRLARFRAACGFAPSDVAADVQAAAAHVQNLRLELADAVSDD